MSEPWNFTAGKQNYNQRIEDSSKQNYDRLNRTMVGLLTSIAGKQNYDRVGPDKTVL
jgi:hypothetical protein